MKVRVRDILKKKGNEVISISTGSSLLDAARLMRRKKIGALVVMGKKETIIGIVTERDVMHEVDKHDGDIRDVIIDDVMSRNIIIGVPDDDAGYIMGIMTKNRIRHMPIVENKGIVGFISIGDLVKSKLEDIEFQKKQLSDYFTSG